MIFIRVEFLLWIHYCSLLLPPSSLIAFCGTSSLVGRKPRFIVDLGSGRHPCDLSTCHVGVPSCGQRHRDTFSPYYLLICTITNIIHKSEFSTRLVSAFSISPPTHSYITMALHHLPILKPNPVEEDRWKGFIRPVHRPSPRGAVVCFHAPPRLPG